MTISKNVFTAGICLSTLLLSSVTTNAVSGFGWLNYMTSSNDPAACTVYVTTEVVGVTDDGAGKDTYWLQGIGNSNDNSVKYEANVGALDFRSFAVTIDMADQQLPRTIQLLEGDSSNTPGAVIGSYTFRDYDYQSVFYGGCNTLQNPPINPDPDVFAYVANYSSKDLSVIDLNTNSVIATVPVQGHPTGVVFSPDGNWVFVATQVSNGVAMINTSTNAVAANISLGEIPEDLDITPDGKYLYAIMPHGSGNVAVIDVANRVVSETIPTTYSATDIEISPDGEAAYITHDHSQGLSVIKTDSKNVRTIFLQSDLTGIAFSPAGDTVYVSDKQSGRIWAIDAVTDLYEELPSSSGASFDLDISSDGSTLVAPSLGGGVSTYDIGLNSTISELFVGEIPTKVAITPDDQFAYITISSQFGFFDGEIDAVAVYDIANNAVVEHITVGHNPWGIAIGAKGAADGDGDGIADTIDNCPTDSNPLQDDNDGDTEGDVCDLDDDNDSVMDIADNCPLIANADQADGDYDGLGDLCDAIFNTDSAVTEVNSNVSDIVSEITDANPPGGNGLINKLTGQNGLIPTVNLAISNYDNNDISKAEYLAELQAALDILDGFDNQLTAKINNGQIVNPEASSLQDLSDQIRTTINNLILNS